MLIAHISDTHLGLRQYNLDEREEDFYRAYNELIDKIIEEHVDIVIHSGDLFESPRPPTKALLVVQESMFKLQERGIKVYAIPGSHDQLKKKGVPPHALFKRLGMKVLTTKNPYDVVELNGKKLFIGGVQHIPKVWREVLLANLKYLAGQAEKYDKRILILHQSLKEFFPVEYELSIAELPQNFHYYALGHIHRRAIKEWGKGVLAYAGSTEVWNRTEYEAYLKEGKGAYIIDLSSDEPIIHKINIDNIRPHIIEEIDSRKLTAELYRISLKAKRCNLKPVIHLIIKGDQVDRRVVQTYISKILSPYALTVRSEFKYNSVNKNYIDVSEIPRINIKELFKKYLNNDLAADLAYRLFELLRNGEIEEAKKLVKEFYNKFF